VETGDQIGLCDSFTCRSDIKTKCYDKDRGVVKFIQAPHVRRKESFCPDCNAALLWLVVGRKHGQKKYFSKGSRK